MHILKVKHLLDEQVYAVKVIKCRQRHGSSDSLAKARRTHTHHAP